MYGCPVGTDAYVGHMLDIKVEEVARGAVRSREVLKDEAQALRAVLCLSMQQQFGYWLSLVHPAHVAAAAGRVDTILLGVLESVAGFSIPRKEDKALPAPWVLRWGGWGAGRSSS